MVHRDASLSSVALPLSFCTVSSEKHDVKSWVLFIIVGIGIPGGSTRAASFCGPSDKRVVDLTSGKGPLAKARVKDQDGVGICYAETAALMLQAELPGNPEVSSLGLALDHWNPEEGKLNVAKPGLKKGERELYLEGGGVCGIIEKAQKAGGYCRPNQMLLDRAIAAGTSSSAQESVLEALAQFFDSPEKTALSKKFLEQIPELAASIEADIQTFCETPKFTNFMGKIRKAARAETVEIAEMQKILKARDEVQALKKDQKTKATELKESKERLDRLLIEYTQKTTGLRKLLTSNKKKNQLRAEVNDINAETAQLWNADQNLKDEIEFREQALKNWDPQKSVTEEEYQTRNRKILSHFSPNNDGLPTQPSESLKLFMHEVYTPILRAHAADVIRGKNGAAQLFMQEVRQAALSAGIPPKWIPVPEGPQEVVNLFYDDLMPGDVPECFRMERVIRFKAKRLVEGFDAQTKSCSNDPAVKSAAKVVQDMSWALGTSFTDNMPKILEALKTPGQKGREFLWKTVGADCLKNGRTPIPADLKCVDKTLASFHRSFDFKTDLPQVQKDLWQEGLVDLLSKGSPAGISICADLLNDKKFRTLVDECKGYRHAMTVVGYRCQKGKMDYLIQNSWGKYDSGCSWCEQDKNGRSWIPEEILQKQIWFVDVIQRSMK